MYFYTTITKSFPKRVLHFPACNIIVNDANFYALLRFIDESIGYKVTQCVVVKDKHFHMDMIFCTTNFTQKTGKELVSICEDLYFIIFKGQGHALILE